VLTTSVDATATTITVTEYQHGDPASSWSPMLPFTIRLDGEQLRVTARTPGTVPGTFDYTVERGINGTVLLPTAAAHTSGATVRVDVSVPCVHSYLDNQRYDVYGQTSQRQTGDGVVDTTYRDVDTRRLTGRSAMSPDGSRLLMNLRYAYDLVGNVTQFRNVLPPDVSSLFGGPTTQNYTYDGRYRLTAATGTWDYAPKTTRNFTWAATLDDATSKVTRMTQRDWTVDTGCTKKCAEATVLANTFDRSAYTYDSAKPNQATKVVDSLNKRTETYAYDSDGEQTTVINPDLIRNITWDWAGKLTEIVDHNPNNSGRKQTDYVYDYAGQLAIEIKEQGVTYYVNPWVTVRNGTMLKNIWAGNDRLAVNMTTTGDTFAQKVYFMHKDLQGSTNIVTDRTGKVFQHQEYFPTGQVWIKEDNTIFRTPWQYAGGYVDEDHRLINFGDRWYSTDQARFLTVDPILTDDATALVQNPTLTTAYTYGQSDPIGYVDSDGRVPNKANADAVSVLRTIASLKPDGEPITQAQSAKLLGFFAKNTDTFRGRATLGLLKNLNTYQERKAKFFNRLDSRPVLEFELEDGKLKAVKLGFGVGKRLKFEIADKGAGATPQPASSVASSQTGSTASTSAGDANGPGGSGKSTSPTTATTTAAATSSGTGPSGQPPSQGASKPATSADAQPRGSEGK
jgi:RHS repeat-associated protein